MHPYLLWLFPCDDTLHGLGGARLVLNLDHSAGWGFGQLNQFKPPRPQVALDGSAVVYSLFAVAPTVYVSFVLGLCFVMQYFVSRWEYALLLLSS